MKPAFAVVRLMSLVLAGWGVTAIAQEGAAQPKPADKPAKTSDEKSAGTSKSVRVAFDIEEGGQSWGRIVLELDAEKAPETVRNFIRYVEDGYYDGTVFHRVVAGFMIQGGGYTSLDSPEKPGRREPIRNEANNGLKNTRGTIAMARTNAPHSASSEFFINVVDNAFLDYKDERNWGYCVFGKVVEGMEVVDKIRNIPTVSNPRMGGQEQSRPTKAAVIKKAYRLDEKAGDKPKDKPAEQPAGDKPGPGDAKP